MTNLIFTSLLPQNFAEFIHFFGIDSSIKHRIDAEKGKSDGHAALEDANRALAPAECDSSFNGMPDVVDRAAGGDHVTDRSEMIDFQVEIEQLAGVGWLIGPCSCILGATSRMFGGCGPEISVLVPLLLLAAAAFF